MKSIHIIYSHLKIRLHFSLEVHATYFAYAHFFSLSAYYIYMDIKYMDNK